jgi:omega-amidase
MKVAAFQFRGSDSIEKNTLAIKSGIVKASEQNVRVMVTQECALCGYPPIETETIMQIDFQQVEAAIEQISQLAFKHQIYIGLGTILPYQASFTNSMIMISPQLEKLPAYHKRALWGWDREHFRPVLSRGVYSIDNVRISLRICYEVRFPEYFRELFRERVEIACVSLCDIEKKPNPNRYELMMSQLRTRAVENAMHVLSVNSISGHQTAPTCSIDPDGVVLESAPLNEETLLIVEYDRSESNFGRDGRIKHSRELLGI